MACFNFEIPTQFPVPNTKQVIDVHYTVVDPARGTFRGSISVERNVDQYLPLGEKFERLPDALRDQAWEALHRELVESSRWRRRACKS